MARLFYYRHKIGDYDTLTKDLSMLEHGAFRKLLDGYYANLGPLLNMPEKLYRIASAFTAEEQAAVRSVVAQFFAVEGEYLVLPFADEEIARVLAESEKQSAKAAKRWKADSAARHAAAPAPAPATAQAAAPPAAYTGGMPFSSQESKNKSLPPPKPPKDDPFLPPDWLPMKPWEAFLRMRQRIRKPATDHAKTLLVRKLEALRNNGHDPSAVLDQSTENGWQTVYPLKDGLHGRRSAVEDRNDQSAADWAGT